MSFLFSHVCGSVVLHGGDDQLAGPCMVSVFWCGRSLYKLRHYHRCNPRLPQTCEKRNDILAARLNHFIKPCRDHSDGLEVYFGSTNLIIEKQFWFILFYVLGWKLAQTYHNLCEQIQDFSTAIIEQNYPDQFSQLINSVTGKNIATPIP